jgi:hypothetical protein
MKIAIAVRFLDDFGPLFDPSGGIDPPGPAPAGSAAMVPPFSLVDRYR